MEKLRINGKEYLIKSIRQVSTGVLEIAFSGESIPDAWGDFELYTEGGILATTITGYTTLLDVNGSVVKIGNDETAFPAEPEKPGTPYYHQLEKEILSTRQALEQSQQQSEMLTRAASFVALTFTDEQALQVPELYQEWSSAGVSYQAGERVRFFGALYKVLTAHTSQESWTPTDAPSLFAKVLVEDPDVIPEWEQPDSTNPYQEGDKVKHKGKTWESLVDGNVWEPGVTGTETLWKEVTGL